MDGAFVGINGRPWPEAAQLLNQYGLISPGDVESISMYWHFGCLIGNRDMHYGNLSFFLNPAFPLTVCPPYDMLPMLYVPSSTGEIIAREFNPELPLPRERDLWQRAAQAAIDYWQQLSEQSMLSEEFRRIAQENYKTLKNLVQQAR